MSAYSYSPYGRVSGMPSYPYPPSSTSTPQLGGSSKAMGGLMAGAAVAAGVSGYCGSLAMGGSGSCVSSPTGYEMLHPAMQGYGLGK